MAQSPIWIVFLKKPGHTATVGCRKIPGTLEGTVGLAVGWQDVQAPLFRIEAFSPLWIHSPEVALI